MADPQHAVDAIDDLMKFRLVEAMLQVNYVVSTPQEFADTVTVGTTSVDATFPAS